MWFKTFVGSLAALVASMSILAVGEYLLPGLTHFTMPIGGTLTLGGGLIAGVSGMAVMVSGPE